MQRYHVGVHLVAAVRYSVLRTLSIIIRSKHLTSSDHNLDPLSLSFMLSVSNSPSTEIELSISSPLSISFNNTYLSPTKNHPLFPP